MWYWYVIGAGALVIGFLGYSLLVVAGRADTRKDAIQPEGPASTVQSRSSTPEIQPRLNEESEQKVYR